MDTPSDPQSNIVDQQVRKLKRNLEGWREVLALLYPVFVWQKHYYSLLLVGHVTALFLFLWYWDPPVLSIISCLGIVITVADYAVPRVSALIFNPDSWTGMKERHFEYFCYGLVESYTNVIGVKDTLHSYKDNRPVVYFVTVVGILLVCAWFGNAVNNLFLTYLMVCLLVSLPGLKHTGILKKYVAKLVVTIGNAIKREKKA